MTIRKTMAALAAAALMAAVVAGCSKPAPEAKPAAAPKNNPIPFAGKPVNKYDKFYEEKDGVKHFYLWLEEKEMEILKDVKVPVWAFNGTVPGPELRFTEGDKVAVHFRNTASQPHSIHFHGQLGLSQAMDGVPATSATVNPGKEFVYEFTATSSGTMMYHCHVATYHHVDMGMYGAMIIEPKNEQKTWSKEYTLILDDWAVGTMDPFDTTGVHHRDYNYFTVNGKSFPETVPIEGKVGEQVKIRFINMGYRAFSIHSHGYGGLITHLDGYPVPQPYQRDVFTINPGERTDVLITMRDGIYPWHDHNLENVLNNGEYLGGATFLVIGKK
ncbi:MAG TPA: multicopper oxidase domain-containing protein [Symbiobacteriaceae bacterium]|nr:multicopper oxidase domain-containing protein [Symbiobacteriaceae bacterium]